ncbi:MAG: DUF445 family protein [Chitinophagaceae bacterium]|nr:DUF445 family protein [Chitinophagaceae bacterium]MCB0742036.1 DUF445 family protein [Chitinophagaceae bacterium]
MSSWFLLFPLISAFIGWLTNWVAIKMLFHPREPKRILGITFQGIFPKRQQKFAEKLGKLISEEFLSYEDIEAKISNPENLQQIMPIIENHVDDFLRNRLKDEMPVVSMFIGDKTIENLKSLFMQEIQTLLPVVMKQYAANLKTELDLEQIVITKVAAFSSDKLEEILFQIMSKEFRFIEIIGAVIGFLIGALQVVLTYFINMG